MLWLEQRAASTPHELQLPEPNAALPQGLQSTIKLFYSLCSFSLFDWLFVNALFWGLCTIISVFDQIPPQFTKEFKEYCF